MIRILISIAALVSLASAALAQTPAPSLGDSAQAVLGDWEFSNADRNKICTASFKRDPSPVGFKVTFDANCGNLFPLVQRVTGWRFPDNDNLFLLDSAGTPLVEFSEVETGIYEAPTPGVGVLFLQKAADAGPPPKSPEEVAGEWAVRRGGATICALTLAGSPLRDGFAMTVKPGCDAAIARLNLTQWSLDRGELVLTPARGTPWRFEEGEGGIWSRLPESPDRITLVRQ